MLSNIKKIIITTTLLGSCNCAIARDQINVGTQELAQEKALNPFQLSPMNLKYGSKSIITKNFDSNDNNSKKSEMVKIYSMGFEKSLYQEYASWGFDFSLVEGAIMSLDPTFFLKARLPVSIGMIGDISIFAQGNVGISNMFKTSICDEKTRRTRAPNRFGSAVFLSAGVEYYPIEWVGLSLETQSRFYNYLAPIEDKKKAKNEKYNYDPFSFKVANIITAGLKINF